MSGDLDRAATYKFLAKLTETYPDDALGILKDIIVDYWFFPNGDGTQYAALTDLEREVADLMASNQKIHAIKKVREVTGMGLKEAKDYVEQRSWPSGASRNQQALDMQKRFVQTLIQKIGQDYRIDLE